MVVRSMTAVDLSESCSIFEPSFSTFEQFPNCPSRLIVASVRWGFRRAGPTSGEGRSRSSSDDSRAVEPKEPFKATGRQVNSTGTERSRMKNTFFEAAYW